MEKNIHRNALKPGYSLHWYRIEGVLGQGSFGITYLAQDANLDRRIAIKEYLPAEIAMRETTNALHPVMEGYAQQYHKGLDRFIAEARMLAKFKHPCIVQVLNVFEANNTAYMVMTYEEGESLEDLLNRRKILDEAELRAILMPILEGLELIHQSGFIHRDIKPANIFIHKDGSPVLLDFGSARQALGEQTRSLTILFTPGYAPIEQYHGKSELQGPWTDVYALGATLYRATTGAAPADALERSQAVLQRADDPLKPAQAAGLGRYSEAFLKAIDHALNFKPEQRPQTIAVWREEFSIVPESVEQLPTILIEHSERRRARPYMAQAMNAVWHWYIAAGLFMALLGIGMAVWLGRDMFSKSESRPEETTALISVEPARRTSEKEQIEALLANASKDIKAGRLTRPKGGNAFEKYQSVLALQPNQPQAMQGVHAVADKLVQLAQKAIKRMDWTKAQAYLEQAAAIEPNSENIARARQALATRKAESEKQSVVAQQAKLQEAENTVRRFLDLALQAMNQQEWAKAQAYLDQTEVIQPNAEDIILLRDELLSRMAQVASPPVATQQEPATKKASTAEPSTLQINGTLVKIQQASSSQPTVRAGDMIKFYTEYLLTLPAGTDYTFVEATWALKRNGQKIGEEGVVSGTVKGGVNAVFNELTLPQNVKPGKFVVEHRVQAGNSSDAAQSYFSVVSK